jgi:hypothetical protein
MADDRLPPAFRSKAQELADKRIKERKAKLQERQAVTGGSRLPLPTEEFQAQLKAIPTEETEKAFAEVRSEFEFQQRVEKVKGFFRGILGGETPDELDDQALNRGERMMQQTQEAQAAVADWQRLNPPDDAS